MDKYCGALVIPLEDASDANEADKEVEGEVNANDEEEQGETKGYEDDESVLAGINYDSDVEFMDENEEGGSASA